MDLSYSDEQVMLRESAKRLLRETYPFEHFRTLTEKSEPSDAKIWRRFAELGWLAMPISEAHGGLGGGAVEAAILAEALGRSLNLEPFVPAVVLAGGLIDRLGTEAQCAALLGPLVEGRPWSALAYEEGGTAGTLASMATRADRDGAGYRLNGAKVAVLGGVGAGTFLVAARTDARTGQRPTIGVFIVPSDAEGVRVTPFRTAEGGQAADVALDGVRLGGDALLGGQADAIGHLEYAIDSATAALCWDAVGCMDALLAATVEFLKQRVQFRKPLAAFQALQHRVAEMAVKCQEARAIALLASLSLDAAEDLRIRGVAGAKAKIGETSRQVAQEAIQLHGAMGFTDELPVGWWFKRLFVFENRFGATRHHLSRYGAIVRRPEIQRDSLLLPPWQGRTQAHTTSMDLFLSPDEVAFRDEVRAFLDTSLDAELRRAERLNPSFIAHPSYGLRWQAKLAERGWAVPSWPAEYGGPGWTLTQRYLFDQECERYGEPRFRTQGIKMLAPVLMRYGTPEQQQHYLPRIISGEDVWAQGYSEPGAGSDLASLRTKAVRDGDDYVVNGSKIWASLAHESTHIFCLVRTSDTDRRQEGITFLLMPLDAPGVTIRPIGSICGTHEFNEVFFDDVRVPVANRIGEEGQGWEISKYLLEFERGGNFAGGTLRAWHGRLLRLASEPGPDGARPIDDPLVAARFAEIGMDIDANDMMELTSMSRVQSGSNPGQVPAAVMKIERSRIRQAISELAALIIGVDAIRWEAHRPLTDLPEEDETAEERKVASAIYFNSRSQSLLGGSNEIQLEILARNLLR